jgi:hypothetical protein|nr:MAG TPA: hypothetical protein [Bacteriophage sp.]
MIKSKKNTQKLYIELKASGKQVDKYFKRLNQYYPVPKTIIVLKAILEGVDKINSSTKESNVKLENVVKQYIKVDHELRDFDYSNISNSVVGLMSSKNFVSKEKKEFTMKVFGDRIDHSKASIERSDLGENVKDILAAIK